MIVLAIVKFNSGVALVLDEDPKLVYNKYDYTIVGTDGCFCEGLFYERPSENWQAFAGRKFDIQLENGEVEHCTGQWWRGLSTKAISILGETPISVTARSLSALKECYVFCGYWAIKSEYNKLIAAYDAPIYDYWDYDVLTT